MRELFIPFKNGARSVWNVIVALDELPPRRKLEIFTIVCSGLLLLLGASTWFVYFVSDINDISWLEKEGYTVKKNKREVINLDLWGYPFLVDYVTSYELNTFPMVDYDETNLHEMQEAAAMLFKPVTVVVRAVPALKRLEGFEELSNLKVLHIVGGEGVIDVTNLRKSESLEGLSINRVHSLQKLGTLVESPKLRYLWLEQAKSFNRFEDFQRVRNLDVLAIIGNEYLTDVSPLSKIKKLRYLNLSGCPNLTNLKSLKECRTLKKLVLEDCGFSSEEQNQIRMMLPAVTLRFEPVEEE